MSVLYTGVFFHIFLHLIFQTQNYYFVYYCTKFLLVSTLLHEYFDLGKWRGTFKNGGGHFKNEVLVTKMGKFMFFYKHHFVLLFYADKIDWDKSLCSRDLVRRGGGGCCALYSRALVHISIH